MKTTPNMLPVLFVLALSVNQSFAFSQEERSAELDRHFTLQVLPVLDTKCFACHGDNPADMKGELNLTSRDAMLVGGESGEPSVIVGKPEESVLVDAIEWDGYEMPPKENDRLTADQIADIRQWIADGAVWPDDQRQAEIRKSAMSDGKLGGETIETVGGTSPEWSNRTYQSEDIWAFKPVVKPMAPSPNGYSLDAFVDRKLARSNIKPADRADSQTLIRRATYDLTGLPPKPEEIVAFQTSYDANPNLAWSELIDRLLHSPQYGERWGQHWLDVVRYADTSGFSNDYERSNAWRYRDYVIRAFNDDKPYNQFVVEQIAGDELVDEQAAADDGKNQDGYRLRRAEGMVATGFLRMGQWEHTPMTPEKVSRQNYLDDTVNGLSQTFLSTALRCCKCHDHKFDPIPTSDYYRIYAALATTQPAEMPADFLPEENRSQFETQREHVETLLEFAKKQSQRISEKRETAARQWYQDRGRADEYATTKGEKPPRFIGLTTAEEGELKVREQDVRIWTRRLERFEPLAQSVYSGADLLTHSRKLRPPSQKRRNKRQSLPVSFVYAGGDVFSPTDKVTPGVLSALGLPVATGTESDPFALPTETGSRRLTLARWIANENNPLATRSIVNRVWHYHFGKGIAGNPNNFGATGARPTHPELLDWLTTEFVHNGWSIKHLHRMIMKSEAYMRSAKHPKFEQLAIEDPNNELLAVFKPRRLTAEEIRDSMLAASGELNLESGGLPIRPEINREVALSPRMIQFSLSPAYQPERTPAQRNRRSIYAYRIRGLRDPMMEVLDKANPNESCELRDSASTTPQVFALLNSDSVTHRSIAMALRLEREANTTAERIDRAYRLLVGATPSPSLRETLVRHLEEMIPYHRDHPPEKIGYPTRITRSVVEELSGDPFEYEERLNAYEKYTPDQLPSDVSPETRALADVCLLLFNSNQFMYVY